MAPRGYTPDRGALIRLDVDLAELHRRGYMTTVQALDEHMERRRPRGSRPTAVVHQEHLIEAVEADASELLACRSAVVADASKVGRKRLRRLADRVRDWWEARRASGQ